MNNILRFVVLVIFLSSASVHAVPIQGSFSGIVSYDFSQTISGGSLQVPDGALIGKIVTGTFNFDTDNVPLAVQLGTSQREYKEDGSIDWLDMTMSINGTAYDGNQYNNGIQSFNNWDRLFFNDGDLLGINTDQYYVQQSGSNTVTQNGIRTLNSFSEQINVADSTNILTFINLDPGQTFSINDFTGIDDYNGSFYKRSYTVDLGSGKVEGEGVTSFGFDLTSLIVSSNTGNGGTAPTSLPEPSILALMGLGLAGLGFVHRRKLHQS